MTILSVVQQVSLRVIGREPSSAFSPSHDRSTVKEITDLANDVARSIAETHDWQALTKIGTITGDGTTTKFPLPVDYDRMSLASDVVDSAHWFWGYHHIPSVTEWLLEESYGFQRITPGGWIVLQDEFNFVPAPSAAQVAAYPYISKHFVKASGGTRKERFTEDNDEFILDERLLVLGTLWRWKEQKSLEYAEDMQNFEDALSRAMAKDGGSRYVSRRGRPRGLNLHVGWPWPLGG